MAGGNLSLILVIVILLPTFELSINLTNVIFFTLLFTVFVTTWDRYRQVHRRLLESPAPGIAEPAFWIRVRHRLGIWQPDETSVLDPFEIGPVLLACQQIRQSRLFGGATRII